jgi:hypothetical protein
MRINSTLNRIPRSAPPEAYQTFRMVRPLDPPGRKLDFWRQATCEEAECDPWRYGFEITVDTTTPLGERQYDYLARVDKSRSYKMTRTGHMVTFVYAPGNPCFESGSHRTAVERYPRFLVCEGDWRGNPRGIPVREHTTGEFWVEECQQTLDAVRKRVEG